LAQHALSPANALDARNIAAATNAVVVILIMVIPQIAALSKAFKLFLPGAYVSDCMKLQPARLPLQ